MASHLHAKKRPREVSTRWIPSRNWAPPGGTFLPFDQESQGGHETGYSVALGFMPINEPSVEPSPSRLSRLLAQSRGRSKEEGCHSPLSILMQNRCLNPWWERGQVITSGLEQPVLTDLLPTITLQP